MKIFSAWLFGTVIAFGALAGAYHVSLGSDPHKVVVIVDSSYAMSDVWHRVEQRLQGFDERRYTEFALLTDKGRAHGWSTRLKLALLTPYGPRSFERLLDGQSFPELSEADEVYILTNAPANETAGLGDWEILRP